MTSLSNILLDKEILLESGTNELELLVFDVADFRFGINVAKVREVLPKTEITGLPQAHSSIRGVFKLREQVIPCVSLMDHLGITSDSPDAESTMILTDFNQQQTAFLVDSVERIHRLSWENILAVPGMEALSQTPVTALARCNDRLIVMLDFEMIIDEVTDQYFRTDAVENPLGLPREKLKILLAEDSPTVREAIGNTLRASGYTHLLFFENGADAWDWMERWLEQTDRVEEICDLVICDIEMPQVDGFHLTKRIKDHPQLKQLPVLLYSSIVTPDNAKKGKAVGADAQVAKPELREVVRIADELISTAQRDQRGAALQQVATAIAPSAEPVVPQPAEVAPEPAAPTDEPSPVPMGEGQPAEWFFADETLDQQSEVPAEQPPGEVPVPTGVDLRLWRTFHRELSGRAADVRIMLDRTARGDHGDMLLREFARTLHTIKSAAMVIPLERVSHCTHLAEGLLEGFRERREQWPQEPFEHYLAWLQLLVSPAHDVNEALAAGARLEAELAAK